jgi:hypothetical protein
MATIPDTMRIIAKDIQNTFDELVKLLLRKSLHPVLNPLHPNAKIVYNSFRNKYERGMVGSTSGDNINKYSYLMTHDSLGWNDEVLANFKIMAKFIKNNTPVKFPTDNTKQYKKLNSTSKVAFSDREIKDVFNRMRTLTQYQKLLSFLSSKSAHRIITNKRATFTYLSDIPYTYSFRQLESIGKDIIEQTDPIIDAVESAKMSTAMLRAKLYILERDLSNLSINHPNIFDAYVEMLRIINSVPRKKMNWVISLIAMLSYQRWENLTTQQHKCYLDYLGESFISAFDKNELITILLQGNASEVILTSSYLYPLLKMLFIVFGYSRLVPIIVDNVGNRYENFVNRLGKHLEKYRGAFFRRGDQHHVLEQCDPSYQQDRTENSESSVSEQPQIYGARQQNIKPVDQYIYEFIKLFGNLYPTIIGLMGGTEYFPPENIEVNCSDIPPNYDGLTSLPEYLWRFNDYSYCKYLEYLNSKQLYRNLDQKISAKARYLQSI